MGTKSREVIYGGRIRAAKMNVDRARKLAVEAAREADRAEAHALVPAYGRLWWTGSGPHQLSRNVWTGVRLARSEVPPVRDSGQRSPGCRPPIPQHADLEVGSGAEMPVVPNAAVIHCQSIWSGWPKLVRSHRICGFTRTMTGEAGFIWTHEE